MGEFENRSPEPEYKTSFGEKIMTLLAVIFLVIGFCVSAMFVINLIFAHMTPPTVYCVDHDNKPIYDSIECLAQASQDDKISIPPACNTTLMNYTIEQGGTLIDNNTNWYKDENNQVIKFNVTNFKMVVGNVTAPIFQKEVLQDNRSVIYYASACNEGYNGTTYIGCAYDMNFMRAGSSEHVSKTYCKLNTRSLVTQIIIPEQNSSEVGE